MYKLKKQLIEAGQRLAQQGLLVAGDGNLSYRLSNHEILITPTGINKARLNPSDIATITLRNQIRRGNPSSERLMHLEIYKQVPEAQVVVHAHPVHAIALSLARPEWAFLPTDSLPEVIIAAGQVPIVPYARPGSLDMGTVLHPYLPQFKLMILARHGALCWSDNLIEAIEGMERLEQICQIIKMTEDLGGSKALPSTEITALKELRKSLGNRLL